MRPREGRKFPPELRPRRVAVLAEQFAQGARDAGFRRLLQRIDQSPIHVDAAVTLYFRGDEAFAAMLGAIELAAREVLLQSYIVQDDAVGDALASALSAAAARGVTVRVLADAFGSSRTRVTYWARLKRSGVKARLVNNLMPALWYGKAYRDHRKILVVDRDVAFTGGMNLGEQYAGRGDAPIWRDTHARITGSAAWEMAVVFAEGWAWARGEAFTIEPRASRGSVLDLAARDAATACASDFASDSVSDSASASASTRPGASASVLVLDSRPLRGHMETAAALAATVAAARSTVWITNAYFAPRRFTVDVLARAARRGVDVRLLLPGVSDVPLVRHAGHGYFSALLQAGIRIFEYQPCVLHAKTLVVDRFASMVGSTNIDFRSFRFNAECNAVILDEVTGEALAAQFERDLLDAREMHLREWQRRAVWHRLGDALARRLAFLL